MLFDRRYPPTLVEKIRVAVWPRRTWRRSFRYVLTRLSRLRTSPHAIAVGAAAGVLVSCTPFIGFHFILAGLLAWALRGSIIASALGTFFGNPLTYPFIWMGSYQLGSHILGFDSTLENSALLEQLKSLSGGLARSSFDALWSALEALWPIMLKPMVVGGIPLGLMAALISYYLIRKLTRSYQDEKGWS